MSVKKIISGLTLSLLLSSGAANADGNKLLAECQILINALDSGTLSTAQGANFAAGNCIGISNGVRTTLMFLQPDIPQDSAFRACLPEGGINNGQAVRIIASYLKKNPSELHLHESILAIFAFLDAYPCK
jgi:hypothetical protein